MSRRHLYPREGFGYRNESRPDRETRHFIRRLARWLRPRRTRDADQAACSSENWQPPREDWPEYEDRAPLARRTREVIERLVDSAGLPRESETQLPLGSDGEELSAGSDNRQATHIRARLDRMLDWIAPAETSDQDELLVPDDELDGSHARKSGRSWIRRLLCRIAIVLIAVQMKFLAAVSAIDEFIELWIASRPRRLMRIGLLSAFLAAAFLLAMSSAGTVSQSALIDEYRLAASLASRSGDDAAAKLWLQKVAWLDPNDPDYQYRLALGAAESGDRDRAKQIMRRIAPDDGVGYGPAHFWRAKQMLAQGRFLPRSRIPMLRHHLQRAVSHSRQNAEAAEMLAQLEIQDGNIDQAISALEPVVRYYPDLKLMLAWLYRTRGELRRASSIAESGLGIFRRRVEGDPDSVTDRVHWARLLAFQEDFERAVLVLQEGAARLPRAAADVPTQNREQATESALDELRSELCNTLISWHDWLQRKAPLDYANRVRVLQLAVNTVPTDRRVLERLALLAAEGRHGATYAREALANALAEGTAPATVHLLLSLDAQNRHDRRAEEQHLRLALLLNPRLAAAANNLAWLLAHEDPPDLNGALSLVQQAAGVAPNHPEIRATRGVIFHRLGRMEEAIVDLESALAELGSRADIHGELASLYETLGNRELADRHRSRAAVRSVPQTRAAG